MPQKYTFKDESEKYQQALKQSTGEFQLKINELKNNKQYTIENVKKVCKEIMMKVSRWVTNDRYITPDEAKVIDRSLLEILNKAREELKELKEKNESELNNFSNEGTITNWTEIVQIRNKMIGHIVKGGDSSNEVGKEDCKCDALYNNLLADIHALKENDDDERKEEQLISKTSKDIEGLLTQAYNIVKEYEQKSADFNKKFSKETIKKYFFDYILKRKDDYKKAIDNIADKVLLTKESKDFTKDLTYQKMYQLIWLLVNEKVDDLDKEINYENKDSIKKEIRASIVHELNNTEEYHNQILTLIHKFGKTVINGQNKQSISNVLNGFVSSAVEKNINRETRKVRKVDPDNNVPNEPFFAFEVDGEMKFFKEKDDWNEIKEKFKGIYEATKKPIDEEDNTVLDNIIKSINNCGTLKSAKKYFILKDGEYLSDKIFSGIKNREKELHKKDKTPNYDEAISILKDLFADDCYIFTNKETNKNYYSNYVEINKDLITKLLLEIPGIKYYKGKKDYYKEENSSISLSELGKTKSEEKPTTDSKKLLVKFKDGMIIECLHDDNKSREEVLKEIMKIKKNFKEE